MRLAIIAWLCLINEASPLLAKNLQVPNDIDLNITLVEKTTFKENESFIDYIFSIPVSDVSSEPLIINYDFTGTAVIDEDFIDQKGSLVLPANASFVTLRLAIIEDQLLEGSETIQLVLLNNDNLFNLTNTIPLVTIEDDEFYSFSIKSTKSSFFENKEFSASVNLEIKSYNGEVATLAPGKYIPFTIVIKPVNNGASTKGKDRDVHLVRKDDYFSRQKPLDIPIQLQLINDSRIEGDEEFEIQVTALVNDSFGLKMMPITSFNIPQQQVFSIWDDDEAELKILDFTHGKEVNSTGATVTIGFTEKIEFKEPIICNYELLSGSANGDILVGKDIDFRINNGKLTIPAGQQNMTLTIPVYDDTNNENTEDFTFKITSIQDPPSNLVLNNELFEAKELLIFDSNGSTLELEKMTDLREGDKGVSFARLRVIDQTNSGLAQDVSVTLKVEGAGATNKEDFVLNTLTYELKAGTTTLPIIMDEVLADSKIEGDELFTLSIESNDTRYSLGKSKIEITIKDQTEWNIELLSSSDATEGSQINPKFSVLIQGQDANVTNELDRPIEIPFILETSSINLGSDLENEPMTVVIPAGSKQGDFEFTLVNDNINEPLEVMDITLFEDVAYELSNKNKTNVAIIDDDPLPLVKLSSSALILPEKGGRSKVKVELISRDGSPTYAERSIIVQLNSGGDAKNGIDHGSSFIQGSDYIFKNKEVVIEPYSNSVSVEVLALADNEINEKQEEFIIIGTIVNNNTIQFFSGENTLAFSILNEQSAPYFFIGGTTGFEEHIDCSNTQPTINELIISVSEKLQKDTKIKLIISGSAEFNVDYQLIDGDKKIEVFEGLQITMPRNSNEKKLIIEPIDDFNFEGDETIIFDFESQENQKFRQEMRIKENDPNPNLSTISVVPAEIVLNGKDKAVITIRLFDKDGDRINCVENELKEGIDVQTDGFTAEPLQTNPDGSFSIEVLPLSTGFFEFSAFVANKKMKDLGKVRVFSEKLIPNELVTPNQDGVNDTWKIKGIEEFPDNTVKIYNSLGNLVWETNAYNNNENFWNGSSNINNNRLSAVLNTGTYYYVIKVSGKRKGEGFIELLR